MDKYTYAELEELRRQVYPRVTVREPGAPDIEISAEVISDLAREFQTSTDKRYRSLIAKVFQFWGDTSYKYLLAPLLSGPDPYLADTALTVLCEWWGLTSEYREQLNALVRGVLWDNRISSCQSQAIRIVHEYFWKNTDQLLLCALIDAYQNPSTLYTPRGEARSALEQILGISEGNIDAIDVLAQSIKEAQGDCYS